MSQKKSIPEMDEIWKQSIAFCPKCGRQSVWIDDSAMRHNYEDNAGDYYICTSCYHDWHMYGLDGYHGVDKTRERAKALI